MEEVKDFKYLGSFISSDSNIETEISSRIGQAAQAFKKLKNIWSSTSLTTRTKLNIYRSNVQSTLLYAAETWRTNKKLESRLRGFGGRCLRRILGIGWEQRITNEEVWERTGFNNIVLEVKRKRCTWLGHVLRMKKGRHPLEALSWAVGAAIKAKQRTTPGNVEADSRGGDEDPGQDLERAEVARPRPGWLEIPCRRLLPSQRGFED